MFNRKYQTVNPWELSHHFHVGAYIYDRNNHHVGAAQLWAESENELYAVLEVEGWENNPKYRDIICSEIINGEVVRQWTLEEV